MGEFPPLGSLLCSGRKVLIRPSNFSRPVLSSVSARRLLGHGDLAGNWWGPFSHQPVVLEGFARELLKISLAFKLTLIGWGAKDCSGSTVVLNSAVEFPWLKEQGEASARRKIICKLSKKESFWSAGCVSL